MAMGGKRRKVLALLAALLGCSDGGGDASNGGDVGAAPWQRSEERADCAEFDLLRRPHFGDLHVHTSYSADASIFGTRSEPRDAYAFATGSAIALSDADELPTRSARIDRPLDFAAVTDHAEWLGEVRLCSDPQSPVYDIEECRLLRQSEDPSDRFSITVAWLFPAGVPNPPPSLPFCDREAQDCDLAAASVWGDIQLAAEEAYDRTAACRFTTFVGYENTASLLGRHRHRNVIFRNAVVPALPASQLETDAGGFPQGLWTAIEGECLDAGTGCDAVIIPHNSNLSGGEQFFDPLDAADAQRRQDREPLVEMFQHKGSSECRFDRLAGAGVGTEDELCAFEQLLGAHELPGTPPPPIDQYPRRNMVRNALADGLVFEETLGVNPFKMGFIGSSDTHDATPGNVDELEWEGAQGSDDATPERLIGDNVRNNPGGLAVVWAEENSRDALFAALRRRETYATSGTRPTLRFFGGELTDLDCNDADFVRRAYRTGTPMGGEVGGDDGVARPRFAVLAFKDPGSDGAPGTDLQRVQIVKAWVDAQGRARERVFDVAGQPADTAVDPRTCGPARPGLNSLCAIWEDAEFDPAARAFYYARLLESPTCRWSTVVCRSQGVDPFAEDCRQQAEAAGAAYAACCDTESDDPFRERTVQERAWSSPIWYRPEAIGRVDGAIAFDPAGDAIELSMAIGRLPDEVDPGADAIEVSLADGGEIFAAVFESGLAAAAAGGVYAFDDPSGDAGGLRHLSIEIDAERRAVIRLHAVSLALDGVDRDEHALRVRVAIGGYRAEQVRFWERGGDRLETGSPAEG